MTETKSTISVKMNTDVKSFVPDGDDVCLCSGTKSRYVDVLNPGRTTRPAGPAPVAPADLFAPLAPMAMPANLFVPGAGMCYNSKL